MDNKIKITKDIRFGYKDLMREVDFSEPFTLKDILIACINSKIPMDILISIFQCPFIKDYYDESNREIYKEHAEIEYLEIYWWGTVETLDKNSGTAMENSWCFHGVGKKGVIPEDLQCHCNFTDEEKKNYREKYAIEMTPIYKLSGLPIKMSEEMLITDYDKIDEGSKDNGLIKFMPSITLIELLNAIFYELSFCGSIAQRDEFVKDLEGRVEEIDKWKEEGTLDQHLIPWEEVRAKLKGNINGL